MKKLLITLLALLCTLTLCAALSVTALATQSSQTTENAEESSEDGSGAADDVVQGSCGDDISWFLNRTTGHLDIVGTGAMNFDENHVPWKSYKYDIRTVYISDGITNIPNLSFDSCPHLYAVTIGKDVTSIGTHAFANSQAMLEIYNKSSMVIYAGHGDFSTGLIGLNAKNVYTPTSSGASKIVTVGDFVFYRDTATGENLLLTYTGKDTSVTLPDTETSYAIYYGAFYNKRNIKEITISQSVYRLYHDAFYRCTGLTELYIPDSVSYIQTGAVMDCTSLTHVRLGSGLLIIEDDAFYNCDSLVEVCNDSDFSITKGTFDAGGVALYARNIYKSKNGTSRITNEDGFIIYTDEDGKKTLVKYVGDEKDVVIPDGIYEIMKNAFLNLDITSVFIPSSVQLMRQQAFYLCDELTEVTMPATYERFAYIFDECPGIKSVTLTECDEVPTNMFAYAQSLEEIHLPDGLTTIWDGAFQGCSSLKSMVIPDTVTLIRMNIFEGCTSLESLTIPFLGMSVSESAGIKYIFEYNGYTESLQYNYRALREVTLTKATEIGMDAFKGWHGLVSITLPETLTKINDGAFSGCYALSEVYNLSSLDIVAGSDTHGGVALNAVAVHTSLDEPSAVTWVGDFAFTKDEQGKYTLIKYSGKDEIVNVPFVIGEDEYAITHIAPYAFSYNDTVTEVYLPFGVEEIGAYAFYKCSSLTKLSVPPTIRKMESSAIYSTSIEYNAFEGVKYLGCEGTPYIVAVGAEDPSTLTSYVAHEQTTVILNNAFSRCSKLESVTLTDNLVYIGIGAFNVYSVKQATVPAWALDHLVTSALEEVTIISGDTLPANAFANATKLKVVNLHERLQVIGDSAFYNCSSLESITLPDNVCKIEASAFEKCKSLVEIKLPASLREIPMYCFKDCTALTTVDLFDSSILIGFFGKGAFENCTALNKVMISGGDTGWFGIEFEDQYANPTYYSKALYVDGELLTDLEVPFGTHKIGAHQFVNNTAIKSIHIYEGTQIESGAFAGCMSIESATMPADLFTYISKAALKTANITLGETLPSNIFMGCTTLESVTLPEELTSIGKRAFYGCTSLKSIYIPAHVNFIGEYAFSETNIERVDAYNLEAWCAITFENYLSNPASNGTLYVSGAPLEVLDIPETVTSVSDYAFYNCTSVSVVAIRHAGVTVGEYSLYGIKPTCLIIHTDYIPTFADFKSELTAVEIVGGDTISAGAFAYCDKLSSVILPEKLTVIGSNAFEGCTALESILIPEGVTTVEERAFADCTALTSIAIPESITQINDYTFYGCSSLTEIAWHDKLTAIGNYAFSGCSSLKYIKFGRGLTDIGKGAFSSCTSLEAITIPENVERIGQNAFAYCGDKMTYLNIENPDVELGGDVFYGCDSIESATVPMSAFKNVSLRNATIVTITNGETLPDNAFYGNTKLQSITLPKGLTYIGEKAFYDCSALNYIDVPSSVTSIGSNAFSGCSALKLVHCDSMESWLNIDFSGNKANPLCNGATFTVGDSSSDIVIPEGTVKIKDYAFSGMANMIAITIPNSLTEIGCDAFYGCYNIQRVIISDMAAWCGITFVGAEANPLFYAGELYIGDDQVKEAVIPDGVTKLLPYVFAGATSIESVKIPPETTSFDLNIFYNCNTIKYVLYCGEELADLTYNVSLGGIKVEHHKYEYVATDDQHYQLCSVCGSKTDAMPHSFDTMTDDYLLATHTSEGYAIYVCLCGHTSKVVLPVMPHDFYVLTARVEPTHMTEGYERYTCPCGETKDYPIEKLADHEWDNGTVATAPTHTQYGTVTYTCPCGESYTEDVDKLYEHVWDAGTVTTAPTHLSTGTMTYTCECGDTYIQAIDRTPEHTFGQWTSIDSDMHTHHCDCGASENEYHHFADSSDATCDDCGYTRDVTPPESSGDGNETNAPEGKPEAPGEPETKPEGNGPSAAQPAGCGSSMSGGAFVALVLSMALAFPSLKKKKD